MKNTKFKTTLNCILLFVILITNSIQAQVNYVKTWTATAPDSNAISLINRNVSDVKEITSYFDGLGRNIQSVIKQGSLQTSLSTSYDLVNFVEYDQLGRQNIEYLPYVAERTDGSYQIDPITNQNNYYNNNSNPFFGQGEKSINAHTLLKFDNSPLNRKVLSMSPGNSWVGSDRGIGFQYWSNTAIDDVKIWTVIESGTPNIFVTSLFVLNSLVRLRVVLCGDKALNLFQIVYHLFIMILDHNQSLNAINLKLYHFDARIVQSQAKYSILDCYYSFGCLN